MSKSNKEFCSILNDFCPYNCEDRCNRCPLKKEHDRHLKLSKMIHDNSNKMKEQKTDTKITIVFIVFAIVQIFLIAMAIINTITKVDYTIIGIMAAILGFMCLWFGIRQKYELAILLGLMDIAVVIQNLIL